MSKSWKVCIIGLGYWSDIHFRAWLSASQVEITAIVDLDTNKLAAKAELYGFQADQLFTSLEEALDSADIDIVDVVTRPDSHRQLVEICALRGKQIVCQKPFAPTVEECVRMVEVCEQQDVTLMVAEGWRWHAHYIKLKEIIGSGVLGKISFAKIVAKWFFTPTFSDPEQMSQPYFREMEKLMLYEMAPHWIDAYRSLFGNPDTMTGFYTRVSPHVIGDDLAIMIFQHEAMTGMIEAGWASREFANGAFEQPAGENLMEYVWIEGDKAGVRLTIDGVMEIVHDDKTIEHIEYGKHDLQESHNRLHQHFIDCLNNGVEPDTSGKQYLNVMEIIETTYRTGRRVESIG